MTELSVESRLDDLKSQFGNVEVAVSTLIDKVNELEEKMLWGFEELGREKDKPLTAEAEKSSEDSILNDILAAKLNPDDLVISEEGNLIRTKKFTDLWSQYNSIMVKYGYGWVKGVGWKKGEFQAQPAPVQAPQQAPPSDALEGVVKGEPSSREVNTKAGPKTVTDFMLTTGNAAIGDVRVSIWEADIPPIVKNGVKLRLTGIKMGDSYKGMLQYSGGKRTNFSILA